MPARCGSCGKPPRSYWKSYSITSWKLGIKDQFRTVCQHCGTDVVRQFGSVIEFGLGALAVLAVIAAALLIDAYAVFAVTGVVIAVISIGADAALFQVSRWDPVQPGAAAPPAQPPAG